MKDLTKAQVMTALSLAKHPLIASASVEVNKNLSRISIRSEIGAEFSEVDKLIFSELGKLLPGIEYMGLPAKYVNGTDDVEQELYFINWEGETLIYLTLRICKKWSPEEIIREG